MFPFCTRTKKGDITDCLLLFMAKALLQFFLNHRRFLRSERPERAGKSPAELLSGSPHPHWLEMLGYVRFSRN